MVPPFSDKSEIRMNHEMNEIITFSRFILEGIGTNIWIHPPPPIMSWSDELHIRGLDANNLVSIDSHAHRVFSFARLPLHTLFLSLLHSFFRACTLPFSHSPANSSHLLHPYRICMYSAWQTNINELRSQYYYVSIKFKRPKIFNWEINSYGTLPLIACGWLYHSIRRYQEQ